ncbi:SDR family oxidoreductase [Fulvivirga lutea]|uniref:SDR family oxidoreductase n=1 Tax=Fulvivirga lutea TaxID=2810512 RepID=A0A975A2A3_9BACT|nr:SDR family oxidoreductase [Fulvivirga lutea]QSE99246.1 SDR family oxidoreductase [Fulvivirga lutea]
MKSKTVVVTGANRGIGKQIVKELAEMGHHLIIAARDNKSGSQFATELKDSGYQVEFRKLDLENPESIHDFAKGLYTDYEKIDVLINNAAVFLDQGENVLSVAMDTVRKTVQINLYGPMDLTKTLINLLKGSEEGRIINISSELGAMIEMAGLHPAYRLSKVGLNAFTKIAADDLSETNIKINSMCPGWVKTDMGGKGAQRSVEQGADTAVWLATAEDIPNGKFLRDRKEIEW